MLPQQRRPDCRILCLGIYPPREALSNRGLVGREDERRSLGNDLSKTSGTLPTPGEGADTVDASDVGQIGEVVRDG